jgi:hypothetical protein
MTQATKHTPEFAALLADIRAMQAAREVAVEDAQEDVVDAQDDVTAAERELAHAELSADMRCWSVDERAHWELCHFRVRDAYTRLRNAKEALRKAQEAL